MDIAQLIEELQRLAVRFPHLPVKLVVNRSSARDIDRITFEGTHVEIEGKSA